MILRPPVSQRPPRKSPAQKRPDERGIALIMVVIAISILTIVSTEFAYTARVDLQMATNARDELRAHYLAKSGIGLGRLLLRFQKQLDAIQLPNLAGIVQSLTGGGAAGAAGADPLGAAPQASNMSIQLWRMARVDCHMLQGMVTSSGPDARETRISSEKFGFDEDFPEAADAQRRKSFGSFEGCFLAQIQDEEEKINLNKLNALGSESRPVQMLLTELFQDKRFEFLFEREDANRVKMTPEDQITALRDWIDEDETQSRPDSTGVSPEPFIRGFSDENGLYDRYSPRYKAKNAYFDSLDEVYQVHGVNDRFMAAFRDRLTVYPDINSRINVNSDDPVILYMAIVAVSDPVRRDPRLRDPVFIDALITKIRQARMFAIFGMSGTDFVRIVESAGVAVNRSILNNYRNNRVISDKSKTFTVKATGEAGAVQRTLTAVVYFAENGGPELGRLVHWREE